MPKKVGEKQQSHLNDPVLAHASKDFTTLREDLTVGEALATIRTHGAPGTIEYFYVVDAADRLVGVLPTRKLLTAPLAEHLSKIMLNKVVTIPASATLADACELFATHKYLAFPVVDDQKRVAGVVTVNVFTEEVFDIAERQRTSEMFESLGFRVSQLRNASAAMAFRYRFPWLITTIVSGTLCALLTSGFEATLAQTLALAFFLTMVLGLGESVSIQSMTLTIQALRSTKPTWRWYLSAFAREISTAFMLGAGSGFLVGLVVFIWFKDVAVAGAIGGSLVLALCSACLFGLSMPALLHALKLDPKIAAGPVTLALADLATLLFYFSLASWLL